MAGSLEAIRAELEGALAGREEAEVTVTSEFAYAPEEPIPVRVRKRGHRYDLDDLARATELAGRRPGWLEVADEVVAEGGLNVNRAGVVFVSAVEGRDLAALAHKAAEASRAVYAELLEYREGL